MRKPQFSLRTLLIVMVAVCIVMNLVHRERTHAAAVDEFWRLGGHVSVSTKGGWIVHFWRHKDVYAFEYVEELEPALRCLERMKAISLIVLTDDQWSMRHELS